MRGYKHPLILKKECIKLRSEGLSLNELSNVLKLPKTTVYDWVSHKIILSPEAKERIQKRIIKGSLKGNQSVNRKSIKFIPEPDNWTPELASIVGHFLFDGYRLGNKEGYAYCSRNLSQIERMNRLVLKVFKIKPSIRIGDNNVIRSQFFSVKLNKYINNKKREIFNFLPTASFSIKQAFLRAFFDDEGCITFSKNKKQVRGFQHSEKILKSIQNLLQDFGIKSHINNTKVEITISRKENLIKFQKEINFSPDIFINHKRKNGIWKYKIDKRSILNKAIESYQC